MRHTLLIPALAMLVACGSSDPGNEGDKNPTETGGPGTQPTIPGGTQATDDLPISTFTEMGFMLETLAVIEDSDTDGDDKIDNNLPNVIELVELTLGSDEFSVEAINAALVEGLYPSNIILFNAKNANNTLNVDLLYGDLSLDDELFVDPLSFDGNGIALNSMQGTFIDQFRFWVDDDMITLPLTLNPEDDAVNLQLYNVLLSGNMEGTGSDGVLRGVIPVDQVVNDIAEPLVPEEGVEVFGSLMTKAEVMELIWDLAPLIGDVDLGDEGMGVSAALNYTAAPAAF